MKALLGRIESDRLEEKEGSDGWGKELEETESVRATDRAVLEVVSFRDRLEEKRERKRGRGRRDEERETKDIKKIQKKNAKPDKK